MRYASQRVCSSLPDPGGQGSPQRILVNVLHADEWKIGPIADRSTSISWRTWSSDQAEPTSLRMLGYIRKPLSTFLSHSKVRAKTLRIQFCPHPSTRERLKGIDGKRMIPKCGWEMQKKAMCVRFLFVQPGVVSPCSVTERISFVNSFAAVFRKGVLEFVWIFDLVGPF